MDTHLLATFPPGQGKILNGARALASMPTHQISSDGWTSTSRLLFFLDYNNDTAQRKPSIRWENSLPTEVCSCSWDIQQPWRLDTTACCTFSKGWRMQRHLWPCSTGALSQHPVKPSLYPHHTGWRGALGRHFSCSNLTQTADYLRFHAAYSPLYCFWPIFT